VKERRTLLKEGRKGERRKEDDVKNEKGEKENE
jgi:hypothetical protein